jgi:hypothetical protein
VRRSAAIPCHDGAEHGGAGARGGRVRIAPMKVGILLSLVAAILVALAAPATAGGPGTPKLKGAKHKAGPYSGELRVRVKDSPRSVYVKVISTYSSSQDATITEGLVGNEQGFLVKWYRGSNDISHDVQTSGFDFKLKPDHPKLFRARVKPLSAQPGKVCLYSNVQVTVPSTGRNGPFFAINGPIDQVCVP